MKKNKNKTIRELQTNQPWIDSYSNAFHKNPSPHKDFAHALLHTMKAAGKLAALAEDADHTGTEHYRQAWGNVDIYLADLVVCAIRMANTCPLGFIDLQEAVQKRIAEKDHYDVHLSGLFVKRVP